MISSILTPVRWYNTLAEQDRFSNDCQLCEFELISDKTRLLPWQFTRPASGYLIDKWFLRKKCVDYQKPLIDTNASSFTLDDGFWDYEDYYFENGKFKAVTAAGSGTASKPLMFVIGKKYTIKIIVSTFIKNIGSTFTADITYKTSTTLDITEAGTYTVTFIADSTFFSIDYYLKATNETIEFDSIQVYEVQDFSTLLGDIELPKSLITIANIGTVDVLQYVGDTFNYQIPCGDYYMVLSTGEASYFSEIITVKDFIPSQSPYTIIEWFNSCNISDVVYQSLYGSSFFNRIYVDGILSKPIYPFKEEGEEDGNNDLNILFQKWEKQSALMVAKCPEFIVDSLTAIRLHDTVSLTKPLAKNQIEILDSFEVVKVETTLTQVFNDCATNTELLFLLKNKVIDATCCTTLLPATCKTCDYTVSTLDTLSGGYFLGTPFGLEFGFYSYIIEEFSPVFTLINIADILVCITSLPDESMLFLNGDIWVTVPSFITASCSQEALSFHLYAYLRTPDSYAKIVASGQDSGGLYFTYEIPIIYTSAHLLSGVTISKASLPFVYNVGEVIEFYIYNYKLNCDYGQTPNPITFILE